MASIYTKDDLRTMQAWTLERKIQVTQTRIVEWYERYSGKVYVSFSGGKDSTVLLDLARRAYPDIEAVFLDTGLEYPEIRDFVKTKDNVTWLRPQKFDNRAKTYSPMTFREVLRDYGYPVISKEVSQSVHEARSCPNGFCSTKFVADSPYNKKYGARYNLTKWKFLLDSDFKISDRCCDAMKKLPAHRFEKQTGKHPIVGTMASESKHRENSWLKSGCNAFDATRPKSQPMSFWTDQDVLAYIRRFRIPYSAIYGDIVEDKHGKLKTTGAERTGCMFCPFGAQVEKEPNRFQRMKITHPKIYDYCIRPTEDGGLGFGKVLDYIGVKY